jgi:hypothetical protein
MPKVTKMMFQKSDFIGKTKNISFIKCGISDIFVS